MRSFLCGFLGVVIGAWFCQPGLLTAQAPAASPQNVRVNTIQAHRFELLDLQNRVIGRWHLDQGYPSLVLQHHNAHPILQCGYTGTGGFFNLTAREGESAIAFSFDSQGEPRGRMIGYPGDPEGVLWEVPWRWRR